MSNIGILAVIGLILIVIVLIGWIFMTVRANRHPMKSKDPGGRLKRGPVSGGAIHGDPGQNILTGEAPRQDAPEEHRKNV
ncbi:hypothetical protein [Actinoallomurus iriomotensis]|uniref:Uncharacterized protein n=1 Tax=Actinoallomurus iriomotensis TaxID=478107 RepID=A0A9W6RKX9_9ACTN|nr:hypothetical protein [Actinoallomurus iriomotensis]GLY77659.1 hypothetical protein Airi01_059260 [Actinoallomurus iriomotensis]